MEHDLSARLATALARGGFEKIPGDAVAKQSEAPRHRFLRAVDEDLALHAKPLFIGGLRRPTDAERRQAAQQQQPHEGHERHGSQGSVHGRTFPGVFRRPSPVRGAGTVAEAPPATKAEPEPFPVTGVAPSAGTDG